MDENFFDHIYLKKGSAEEVASSTGIDKSVLESIQKDFDYWYPLDINLGGKEHQTVHFPVFLMNHALNVVVSGSIRAVMIRPRFSATSGFSL